MNVESLIEEIEEIIEKGFKWPMSNKVLVEQDSLKELISEIKLAMPQEIRQAQSIVKDRTEIIDKAKEEAESILRVAEERQRAMINQNEIVRQAQLKASEMISDAEAKCKKLRKSANDYIDDVMKRSDDMLTANLNELKKTRQSFKASLKQSNTQE